MKVNINTFGKFDLLAYNRISSLFVTKQGIIIPGGVRLDKTLCRVWRLKAGDRDLNNKND